MTCCWFLARARSAVRLRLRRHCAGVLVMSVFDACDGKQAWVQKNHRSVEHLSALTSYADCASRCSRTPMCSGSPFIQRLACRAQLASTHYHFSIPGGGGNVWVYSEKLQRCRVSRAFEW